MSICEECLKELNEQDKPYKCFNKGYECAEKQIPRKDIETLKRVRERIENLKVDDICGYPIISRVDVLKILNEEIGEMGELND